MENTQITVTDLAALRDLINVAATRGAFRVEEFTGVGIIYERLNNFLNAYTQPDSSDQAPSEGADADESQDGE